MTYLSLPQTGDTEGKVATFWKASPCNPLLLWVVFWMKYNCTVIVKSKGMRSSYFEITLIPSKANASIELPTYWDVKPYQSSFAIKYPKISFIGSLSKMPVVVVLVYCFGYFRLLRYLDTVWWEKCLMKSALYAVCVMCMYGWI